MQSGQLTFIQVVSWLNEGIRNVPVGAALLIRAHCLDGDGGCLGDDLAGTHVDEELTSAGLQVDTNDEPRLRGRERGREGGREGGL